MIEDSILKNIQHINNSFPIIEEGLRVYEKGGSTSEFYFLAAEKKTEEIVNSAITINQRILANYYDYISENYRTSFEDLKKLGCFSENELNKLASTASFRNRLVHEYLNLDPAITHKSMKNILKLYPEYVKKIKKYLNEKEV